MKSRTTARRNIRLLNDFQIFKGLSETDMKPFGSPVMAHHEAQLMIRDDQASAKTPALYAIHKRSENRILQIFGTPQEVVTLPLAA